MRNGEKWVSDLEDTLMEITQSAAGKKKKKKRKKKEKRKEKECNMRDLLYNIKCSNLQIKEILENEEKEKRLRIYLTKLLLKTSLNLKKETDIQIQ